ncbi:MAG: hypothetical protein GY796_11240 [Chloroflexi bacterium]|nr:hypothetical protein [Chloroflexota bacterium]
MNRKPFAASAALLAFLLLAFGLRLYQLTAQSIWWDEGISMNLARSTLAQISADRVNNIHPPLYFVTLKWWTALVGLNGFTARYLSVLAGFVQVTAVYTVSRRWFGRGNWGHKGVWTAVLLITFSPLSIIYSQEARVYALLPLIYLGLLALATELIRSDHFSRLSAKAATTNRRYWILLGLLEWIGLHLHYIVIFIVIYISLWLLITFIRQQRGGDWRRLLITQIVVGIFSLPWYTAVLQNWTTVQAEANAGTLLTEATPLDFLLKQVWVFHHTGLAGTVSRLQIIWSSAVITLLIILLLLWRITEKSTRRTAARLFLQWFLPLTAGLLVWSVRSFSHPRYISFTAIGLIPLLSFLIYPRPETGRTLWLKRILGMVLLVILIAVSLFSLHLYFFDPAVAKDDMRGTATFVQTAVTPHDLILVPDAGWAFHFEYDGVTPIIMPGLGEWTAFWSKAGAWTDQPRRIITVMPDAGTHDWRGIIPFALEQSGQLIETRPFDGLTVQIYNINQPIQSPPFTPTKAHFGPLYLKGAWVEDGAAADTAVTLALQWQMVEPTDGRLQTQLTLTNEDGLPLAAQSHLLIDSDGRPTESWPVGHVVTTTHVLPIPLGSPPLDYRVQVGTAVIQPDASLQPVEWQDAAGTPQGQQFTLPQTISLTPRTDSAANPYQLQPGLPRLPELLLVEEGLLLMAIGQDRGQISPGQTLLVSLEWLTSGGNLPDLRPRLTLEQNGNVLVIDDKAPANGRYPTTKWQAGETVLEQRPLQIPPEAKAGTAVLILTLNNVRLPLGEVEIINADHNFVAPTPIIPLDVSFGDVGRLVGYDLPQQAVTTAETLPITLYWQAQDSSPTTLTLFVHLLADDGRLIAQHDAPPDNGNRPTTGWVTDEYITDSHALPFREEGYTGETQISVGFYNPVTGARVMLADGRDTFILPQSITITSP